MYEEALINPSQVLLIRNNPDARAECLLKNKSTVSVPCCAMELLEVFCLKHGSTLKGRQDAFRLIMHTRQKTPVLISESSGRIFFPLLSPDDPACIWLCSNEILKCRSRGNSKCTVIFVNGDGSDLDHDARIVSKQMKRCEKYLQILSKNV